MNRIVIAAALWCVMGAASAHEGGHTEIDPARIPLGDGKVTMDGPRVGYVYVCRLPRGGGGAQHSGPWISADGTTWDATKKISVQGSAEWPAGLKMSVYGGTREIMSDGLPDHVTGIFPVQPDDPAYQYDRNPNSIMPRLLDWRLPAHPEIAAHPYCLNMGAIGILLSGARLFNAIDAEGRDAVAHEVQDECQGHPQRNGQYHYHSVSPCAVHDRPGHHSPLVGYAADGFGIYGNLGEHGVPLTDADLDACHGHTHRITVNGVSKVEYHYHATKEFPYTVGCFRGKPVRLDPRPSGFRPRGPFRGRGG